MGNGKELDDATERLATALKAMEDAVASKRHEGLTVDSLEEQVQSLKEYLEAQRQQNEKLTSANDDVSERIDTAIETIENMLKGDT